jgi:ABC-type sugar transport system ATPase subunit
MKIKYPPTFLKGGIISMISSSKILETEGLTKQFPGVLAVDNVDFDLYKGEIHGLAGENGAGKSTFVNMLDGSYIPDKGRIILNGNEIKLNSPKEAFEKGIYMVHQELMVLPHLSVAENICISWLILKEKKRIDWKEINNFASIQLKKMDVDYDVKEKVSNLNIAQQQIVSIARALASNCHLLILDEPTSALAEKDVTKLFKVMKKLKEQNVAMIFISHRLKEILEIVDRLTILRDSKKIATIHIGDLTEDKIVKFIIGRNVRNKYPKVHIANSNEELLRLENINVKKDKLFNISFSLKKGEVLGIVGALGAGKTELALTLFGAYKERAEGKVYLENEEVLLASPIDAIKNGIALISEDRRGSGLILNNGIRFNISLPILKNISNRLGYINKKKEEAITKDIIRKLRINCNTMEQRVENLSGGNQQKVILAKGLLKQFSPDLIL